MYHQSTSLGTTTYYLLATTTYLPTTTTTAEVQSTKYKIVLFCTLYFVLLRQWQWQVGRQQQLVGSRQWYLDWQTSGTWCFVLCIYIILLIPILYIYIYIIKYNNIITLLIFLVLSIKKIASLCTVYRTYNMHYAFNIVYCIIVIIN